jgi:hypothetical protein
LYEIEKLIGLVMLVASIIGPVNLQLSTSQNSQMAIIITLDVCHASDSSLSVNTDTPSLHEWAHNPVLLESEALPKVDKTSFAPSWFSIQIERPPRV